MYAIAQYVLRPAIITETISTSKAVLSCAIAFFYTRDSGRGRSQGGGRRGRKELSNLSKKINK